MTSTEFSHQIRAAAGRRVPETEHRPIGDLGVGRGSSASIVLATRRQSPSVSDEIRAAANLLRGRISVEDAFR
jgi:hypothetical protein